MKLGEILSNYDLFIGSLDGRPTRKFRAGDDQVSVTCWEHHEYTFPLNVEVEERENKFYIGIHSVGFYARRVNITPELLIQAELSLGYVAIDIKKKPKPEWVNR